MDLINREAVTDLILGNKAKHCSERIDADSVCNFERMKRIESRMDEDDDIGNKISKLPSAFDGMTNGQVIQVLFPNIETREFAITIHATTKVECDGIKGGISYDFWKEWWDAPYSTEPKVR